MKCGATRRSTPASLIGCTRSSAARDTPLPNHHRRKYLSREPACRHMMTEGHRRLISPAEPCCAHAHQQLRDFLPQNHPAGAAPEVGAKPARLCEHGASHGHVGAERHLAAFLVDEPPIAVVLDRDRAPQIAAGQLQPRRWRNLPDRSDRTAGVADGGIAARQFVAGGIQPPGSDQDVVIGECDDLASGGLDTGIQRARASLPRLEQIPQANGKISRLALDHGASVVARIVVDDDDFPASAFRYQERPNRPEGVVQERGAVEGRDQDRRVESGRGHETPSTGRSAAARSVGLSLCRRPISPSIRSMDRAVAPPGSWNISPATRRRSNESRPGAFSS